MSNPKSEDMCQEQAVIERFWPGKGPDFVCLEHGHDSANIFAALNLRIEMQPLTVHRLSELGEPPTCACTVGHPQEVVVG